MVFFHAPHDMTQVAALAGTHEMMQATAHTALHDMTQVAAHELMQASLSVRSFHLRASPWVNISPWHNI